MILSITTTPVPNPITKAPVIVNRVELSGPYLLLAYDAGTKKVEMLRPVAKGTSSSAKSLFAATTYEEIQTFATEQQLTNLPADPASRVKASG